MIATVDAMPRKKVTTDVVRIDSDLARKAKVVAAARGISTPDYLSGLLRSLIERDIKKEAKNLTNDSISVESD